MPAENRERIDRGDRGSELDARRNADLARLAELDAALLLLDRSARRCGRSRR